MGKYSLIVIEDTKIPLAGSIPSEGGISWFFILTIAFSVVLFLGLMCTLYIMECNRYRQRICRLTGIEKNDTKIKTWNIFILKDLVLEEEANMASLQLNEPFSL